MSGFHSNFVLFVLISCATSVQVQEKEHLRHRIVLSEIDREAFHGRSHHSVQRRAVSNGTTPAPTQPPVIGHFARLAKDNHQLAIVHWSGANSTVSALGSGETKRMLKSGFPIVCVGDIYTDNQSLPKWYIT